MADSDKQRLELLKQFRQDRKLAHRILFKHRHPEATPPFHDEIIDDWNSTLERSQVIAFRGGAKSTLSEETMILDALFEDFSFGVIIGESFERACERLESIKHELITNDALIELFNIGSPSTWASDEIVLWNNVKIQAIGARQAILGLKHHDKRPDYAQFDDIENEESVATPEARRKMKRWFFGTILPLFDPIKCRIRVVGSILNPDGLMATFKKQGRWNCRTYPVMHLDSDTGRYISTWPERFSLDKIEQIRREYSEAGSSIEFAQQYLCEAENMETKMFQQDMLPVRLVPELPFSATYIIVDPARTTNQATSARTGYVVFSWVGTRLRVKDSFGSFHNPMEIVDTIFKLEEKYQPLMVGVEKDGLEEFLMQPLRQEMLKRDRVIPLVGIKAPKDKNKFIGGLQPFYKAHEVDYEKDMPDLDSELLAFPSGRKDVPNALAYALRVRSGKPVYPSFNIPHIEVGLTPIYGHKSWLLLSARGRLTTGIVAQLVGGKLRIFSDIVREGPPQETLLPIIQEAVQMAGSKLSLGAASSQFDRYTGYGLPVAARMAGHELIQMQNNAGSEILNEWLRQSETVLVNDQCRWTINGFFGGYERYLTPAGVISDEPRENEYRVLFEPLEAFVSWVSRQVGDDGGQKHYATTRDGRRYLSARAR